MPRDIADRQLRIQEAIVAHFAGLAESEQKLADFEREKAEPRLDL
jgi:hypothetical protein